MDKNIPVSIGIEPTPNPHTLKFLTDRKLLGGGSRNFASRQEAAGSVLPSKLFEIAEVAGVMVGANFVSVTKAPAADWQNLAAPVAAKIRAFFDSGEAPVAETAQAVSGTEGEIERKIRRILDEEIRPAVARDGGDIVFHGYENGVVKLHLQGACSHCPSAVFTLRMGVENLLKQAIPEVTEVVQV